MWPLIDRSGTVLDLWPGEMVVPALSPELLSLEPYTQAMDVYDHWGSSPWAGLTVPEKIVETRHPDFKAIAIDCVFLCLDSSQALFFFPRLS